MPVNKETEFRSSVSDMSKYFLNNEEQYITNNQMKKDKEKSKLINKDKCLED